MKEKEKKVKKRILKRVLIGVGMAAGVGVVLYARYKFKKHYDPKLELMQKECDTNVSLANRSAQEVIERASQKYIKTEGIKSPMISFIYGKNGSYAICNKSLANNYKNYEFMEQFKVANEEFADEELDCLRCSF